MFYLKNMISTVLLLIINFRILLSSKCHVLHMSYNLTSKRFYNQESQSMVSSSAKMKSNSKKKVFGNQQIVDD